MSEYQIYLCPFCREQMNEEYSVSHEHEGVRYEGVWLDIVPGKPWHWSLLDAEKQKQAAADAVRKAKAAAECAEIERMQTEWLKTAPPEQVEAWEAQKQRDARTTAAWGDILKDTYKDISKEMNRQSYVDLLFAQTPEEKAAVEERIHCEYIEREQEIIDLFNEHGPARVTFWRLRDAQRRLADLTS